MSSPTTATEASPRATTRDGKVRVKWYRCPVPRAELAKLNKRSDFKGFVQTLGFLGILATTASAAIYASMHWPWYVTAILIYINSMCWHFLINGFHELIHDSVFKTRWLNGAFLRVFSFLGWYSHLHFWASHTEHHKFTLHPPDDLEVVLPQKQSLKAFFKYSFINIRWPDGILRSKLKLATGHIPTDQWTQQLFPESDVKSRRKLINWARIQLLGHAAIVAVAFALGWWIVPLVITFPMMFGGWLHFLCNNSQHIGLRDNVPDYRLCCRTIYLNPIFQFLYWHMNYHTEHHMYAAVPCYNLGKLHRLIKDDMPRCPNGLLETWTQIAQILERQKVEPGYQYEPALPSPSPAQLLNPSPSAGTNSDTSNPAPSPA